MPRQAHGRPLQPGPSKARKRKQKSHALNALEVAEKQNPDVVKIRQSRLGEFEDDSDEPVSRADIDERSGKRRKVTDTRTDQEDREIGSASGSDDEGGRWHEGIDGSDEDSDIDSDDAFGESDEERFADFTFGRSGAAKQKPVVSSKQLRKATSRSVDLNEDDDNNNDGWNDASAFNNQDEDGELDENDGEGEEDDDLGEDAVDLATALDMNMEEERREAERAARKATGQMKPARKSRIDSESEDTNSDADEEDEEASQFSVSEDEREGDYQSLQQFVAGLTPQQTEITSSRGINARSLPDKPSSFGLGSTKLSAADLMEYIKDPTQRQSLKILQNSERSGPEDYKGGIPGKLSVPLAKRQQDRLDRGAAYEKARETLNRWTDTVKQNRRAEHLSFPLFDNAENSAKSSRQLAPMSQSTPTNDLEATVQAIMHESGMAGKPNDDIEDQEMAFEELGEKKLALDEIRARRAQLRMARDLMFREEIRAKRIKKIKSKAYRRVHRKEKDRIEAQKMEALAAAGLINSDEERERNDRRRAEERMGARHRESRWAKSIKQVGRATWDDDAREGVADIARRDEELRRRVEGKHIDKSDELGEGSSSDSDSDISDGDASDSRWQEKLAQLDKEASGPTSKLGSMAFMQRAEAGRKAENDEEIRQLRLAVADGEQGHSESDDSAREDGGRQSYGVKAANAKPSRAARTARNELEAVLSEDEAILADDALREAQTDEQRVKRAVSVRSQNSRATAKQAVRPAPRKSVAPSKQNGVAKKPVHVSDEDTSSSGSDDEAQTPTADGDIEAELAAAVFAGPDDVAHDFAKEKQELVEEEGDRVIDNTLPGWGSWAGAGVSRREQKKGKGRFLTTVKGIDPKSRRDAHLDRVIVNEKRIKKNGKYLATELPHPFENRQQYERSLRLPMGPEWSTANHFQEAIKPRVLIKQGTVVKPMVKPSA